MHSIRTKATLLTVCGIAIAVLIASLVSVLSIIGAGNKTADDMLLLMCETGQKNLDDYFESVEQSVETVSTLVQEDLEGISALDDEQLRDHMDRARTLFGRAAYETNGVLTYYYRIDPEVSAAEKGFWYVNKDGSGFQEHVVTDISLYDTADTSRLVWFTVPKTTGEALWLPPYITENLGARVISYNMPVYWHDQFVGVVGIEIDYSTMAREVDNIQLYENGYAFINDAEGNIIYHPRIDVTQMTENEKPKVPSGLLSDNQFIHYTFEGVERQAVWRELVNGMRLNVSVPVAEANSMWSHQIWSIVIVSLIVLVIMSILAMQFAGHITKPLRQLTEAAKQIDAGNYDIELDYDKDDELGALTRTFKELAKHTKAYVDELSSRAFFDSLTNVRNKGAFASYQQNMQEEIDKAEGQKEFAVVMFDCDDLKKINDQYGHDKGDIYIKAASSLICRVFQHSPVFRVGGDEFIAILFGEDYENRDKLLELFGHMSSEICEAVEHPWERVDVSAGLAVYDPQSDSSVGDVVHRADSAMYENKRIRKAGR